MADKKTESGGSLEMSSKTTTTKNPTKGKLDLSFDGLSMKVTIRYAQGITAEVTGHGHYGRGENTRHVSASQPVQLPEDLVKALEDFMESVDMTEEVEDAAMRAYQVARRKEEF